MLILTLFQEVKIGATLKTLQFVACYEEAHDHEGFYTFVCMCLYNIYIYVYMFTHRHPPPPNHLSTSAHLLPPPFEME